MISALFNKRRMTIGNNALNADMKRLDLISNNIANVNTPGFKRSDIVFSSKLSEALEERNFQGKKTRPRHIDIGRIEPEKVKATVSLYDNTSMRNDKNNVDVEKEMVELAKTQLHYSAMIQALSGEFSKISGTISQAGRV